MVLASGGVVPFEVGHRENTTDDAGVNAEERTGKTCLQDTRGQSLRHLIVSQAEGQLTDAARARTLQL